MLSGVVSQAKTFEMEAASFAILHNVSFDEFQPGFKVNSAKVANNFSKMLSGVVSQAKTFEMEAASFCYTAHCKF